MPNASYYRAQGQLLETLSRNTTDPELARRYRQHAEDYRRRAERMRDDGDVQKASPGHADGTNNRRRRA